MIFLRRPLLIAFFMATGLAASCASCESCDAQKQDEQDEPAVEEPSEADASEEDTRAEMLEEARKQAEELADSAAFQREQSARLIAAELEGMIKQAERPRVKTAPAPDDDGKIDVSKVKQVFRKHQAVLQKCYERALKRDPALQGQVVLTVRIGRNGHPALVKARSQAIKDPGALDCMEREANKWLFPRPQGGTVMLNKPIRFTPDT